MGYLLCRIPASVNNNELIIQGRKLEEKVLGVQDEGLSGLESKQDINSSFFVQGKNYLYGFEIPGGLASTTQGKKR